VRAGEKWRVSNVGGESKRKMATKEAVGSTVDRLIIVVPFLEMKYNRGLNASEIRARKETAFFSKMKYDRCLNAKMEMIIFAKKISLYSLDRV
jgi:hypothetical protein